jgi:hypothetical protein
MLIVGSFVILEMLIVEFFTTEAFGGFFFFSLAGLAVPFFFPLAAGFLDTIVSQKNST